MFSVDYRLRNLQEVHYKKFHLNFYLVPLGKAAFGNLQECIVILDEAVKRKAEMLNDSDSL